MIIREFYQTRKDGVNLYRTYSDLNMFILQNETNNIYAEAIDIESAPYTYSETTNVIDEESDDIDTTIEKAMAYDILMGVSV